MLTDPLVPLAAAGTLTASVLCTPAVEASMSHAARLSVMVAAMAVGLALAMLIVPRSP